MAKDKIKSVVLKIHLATAINNTYMVYWLKKKKKADQHSLTENRHVKRNIHTHNTRRKAESITTHEQSIKHHQTINGYRSILIRVRTGHDIHILAYPYVHDLTDAKMHRWFSAHTCTHICVYGIHIYLQIETSINLSLIKEQTEHNIGEVCINSLGWYDANTVKNKIK